MLLRVKPNWEAPPADLKKRNILRKNWSLARKEL